MRKGPPGRELFINLLVANVMMRFARYCTWQTRKTRPLP
jgi:hypothetical protein